MQDDVIFAIKAPAWRRAFAVAVAFGLGGYLIYLGVSGDVAHVLWQILFVIGGLATVVIGSRMWRVTDTVIELTQAGLTDSNGRVLCRFEDIEKVDRAVFAVKPSNGLLVRLKTPQPTAWVPGLWWRYGHRLGIGGIVAARDTKAMADAITMQIMLPELDDNEQN